MNYFKPRRYPIRHNIFPGRKVREKFVDVFDNELGKTLLLVSVLIRMPSPYGVFARLEQSTRSFVGPQDAYS
jgi:hypothetical protein